MITPPAHTFPSCRSRVRPSLLAQRTLCAFSADPPPPWLLATLGRRSYSVGRSDTSADTSGRAPSGGHEEHAVADASRDDGSPIRDRSAEPTVAALYIDPRGPYPRMPGVDCWDAERDARRYPGPHPVVAHPPCGPWGRLHHMCTKQDRSLGPLGVEQVRRWGGVLEHPADSKLWRYCGLPRPGELPDHLGGFSIAVRQCDWGHVTAKPTWLYIVGLMQLSRLPKMPPPGTPVAAVTNSDRPYLAGLRRATALECRATPPAFAEWLVEVARRTHWRSRWGSSNARPLTTDDAGGVP